MTDINTELNGLKGVNKKWANWLNVSYAVADGVIRTTNKISIDEGIYQELEDQKSLLLNGYRKSDRNKERTEAENRVKETSKDYPEQWRRK